MRIFWKYTKSKYEPTKEIPKILREQQKKYREIGFQSKVWYSLSCISLRHVQFHWPWVEHDWGRSRAEKPLHSRPENEKAKVNYLEPQTTI